MEEKYHFHIKHFTAGILFLLTGFAFYVFFRPFQSTYILENFSGYQIWFPRLSQEYGYLSASAPDFLHPLALSLLSMAIVQSRRARMVICLAWFLIDSAFEILQLYGSMVSSYIPWWITDIPGLYQVKLYLVNGTFDPYDLVAIFFGCITAYLAGEILSGQTNIVILNNRNYKEHP